MAATVTRCFLFLGLLSLVAVGLVCGGPPWLAGLGLDGGIRPDFPAAMEWEQYPVVLQEARGRHAARFLVTQKVIRGELSLLEGATRFKELNERVEDRPPGTRCPFPGAS